MAKTPNIDLREDYQRNYIINGNFDFWQRGAGPISVSGAANPTFAADRFFIAGNGASALDMLRSTDVPNSSDFQSTYSLLVDVTTADLTPASGDRRWLAQRIEGYHIDSLYGKNMTISFWVKATKTGANSLVLRNSAINRSYVTEYAINSANTWEKKEITIFFERSGTWDFTDGIGLEIVWPLMPDVDLETSNLDQWQNGNFLASSNQTNHMDSTANEFRIAQVQVVEGYEAIPFRRAGKTIKEELDLCERYYQFFRIQWNGVAQNSGQNYGNPYVYRNTLRTIPTIEYTSQTDSARYPLANYILINNTRTQIYGVYTAASSGGNDGLVAQGYANAELL